MECVALKKVEMLKCIIEWAKESGIHLSFHGSAPLHEFGSNSRVNMTNALDLAVNSCSPHIAQVLQNNVFKKLSQRLFRSFFKQLYKGLLLRLVFRGSWNSLS